MRVVALGPPALLHSLNVLPASIGKSMTVIPNSVILEPGAIWDGDSMLLSADVKTVQYVRGETAYEDETIAFLGNAYNGAMKRPAWLSGVQAGQSRPLFGLAQSLSPWWGPRGSVCSWLGQFGVFFQQNRGDIELAIRQSGLLLDGLFGFKPVWTTLFFELAASMGEGGCEVFERWVKPADAGPFAGILLGSRGPARISLEGLVKAIAAQREAPTEEFTACTSFPIYAMMMRRAETAAGALAPLIEKLRARL